ncbi:MAG: hypothetical protein LBF95_08160 [Treponema sp.]|jgi:hypothetical protein|nr:hypothetical protein [Treponema sp.]
MKNFFNLFGIIALVAVIGFSMAACDDGDGGLIDGVWDRGDIVVTIDGSSGVFTEVKSNSGWLPLLNNGTISIGGRKFRNITYRNHQTWSGQELTYPSNSSTSWEDGTTFTLSNGGQTLQVVTPNTTSPSTTYTRR